MVTAIGYIFLFLAFFAMVALHIVHFILWQSKILNLPEDHQDRAKVARTRSALKNFYKEVPYCWVGIASKFLFQIIWDGIKLVSRIVWSGIKFVLRIVCSAYAKAAPFIKTKVSQGWKKLTALRLRKIKSENSKPREPKRQSDPLQTILRIAEEEKPKENVLDLTEQDDTSTEDEVEFIVHDPMQNDDDSSGALNEEGSIDSGTSRSNTEEMMFETIITPRDLVGIDTSITDEYMKEINAAQELAVETIESHFKSSEDPRNNPVWVSDNNHPEIDNDFVREYSLIFMVIAENENDDLFLNPSLRDARIAEIDVTHKEIINQSAGIDTNVEVLAEVAEESGSEDLSDSTILEKFANGYKPEIVDEENSERVTLQDESEQYPPADQSTVIRTAAYQGVFFNEHEGPAEIRDNNRRFENSNVEKDSLPTEDIVKNLLTEVEKKQITRITEETKMSFADVIRNILSLNFGKLMRGDDDQEIITIQRKMLFSAIEIEIANNHNAAARIRQETVGIEEKILDAKNLLVKKQLSVMGNEVGLILKRAELGKNAQDGLLDPDQLLVTYTVDDKDTGAEKVPAATRQTEPNHRVQQTVSAQTVGVQA